MTPNEALQFIDSLLAQINVDRKTTLRIMQAIDIISKSLKEEKNGN